MTAHIDDELIDIARMYADGETVPATTRLRFVDLIAEWDARQVGASTRQGLGADGLALADELADVLRGAANVLDTLDDEMRAPLARWTAWREQSAAVDALPELNEEQAEHLKWWRSRVREVGVSSARYTNAADRLNEEADVSRKRVAHLAPVIAHLRADARATAGDVS